MIYRVKGKFKQLTMDKHMSNGVVVTLYDNPNFAKEFGDLIEFEFDAESVEMSIPNLGIFLIEQPPVEN